MNELRGTDEHVNLMFEQYEFGFDNTGEFVIFNDRLSKNVQGGLNHRKVEVKRMKQFIKLLKEYIVIACILEG